MNQPCALVFHGSADLYGSDQTTVDLVMGLLAAGWRVEVALPHTGPLVEVLERAGTVVHVGSFSPFGRATLKPKGLLAFPFQLGASTLACRRLIAKVGPDIVHVNTLIIPAPALAAKLARRPLVWHVHEIMERPARLAQALSQLVGTLADKVICNSKATLAQLNAHSSKVAPKAVVIPNGVTSHPLRASTEVRKELNVATDRFVFLFVGRLNAWKGQQLFVEAAARILALHPRALFLAAGDAPNGQPHFREAFVEAIDSHQLGDSFRWLGFFSDTHALASAADVAVVPSLLPEPFGLVAAEAMAAALPVIAAGHGGLCEIVVDGETGLLTAPGDLDSLVQAMESLIESPERTKQMGQAGKRRQAELFSVERYQAAFLGVYDSLIRPGGAS